MDTSDKKQNIVATIDVNVHFPKVDKRAWLEESLADHLNCVLCGSDLQFKHHTNFIEQVVSEEAHCPHCKIRNRISAHGLQ
jgi:Zn ribbon nucleic-acid-binding protein